MASLYDKFMYPAAHEQKYLTRQDWATSPQMYHKTIMDDYVTNVSKNLSTVPYVGNLLAAGAELGAPIASATLSLPYDLKQSFDDFEKNLAENPDKYNTLGSTIGGIMTAIDEQNPLSSWYHRTTGSMQPIIRRIKSRKQKKIQQAQMQKAASERAMQQQIRQAEAAAKQKAFEQKQKSIPGYGSAPGGGGFDAGTGRTTTSGYSGRRGQKEMMADGGLINFYRYGGFI